MENARSFDTMDAMRGILSIVVVLMHMYIEQTLQPYPFALSAYLGVDCFFVMSGFVIAHAYDARLADGFSPWKFIVARWLRLFPFLLLATLIAVFVQAARWNATAQGPSLKLMLMAVAQCLLLPYPFPGEDVAFPLDMPAWSLSTELVVNLVYALFWKPVQRHLTPLLVLLGVVLLSVMWRNRDADIGVEVQEYAGGLCRAFYGFFLGVWLRRHYRGGYRLSPWLSRLVTPLTFVIMAVKLEDAAAFYYDALCCLFVLPAIIALSARVEAGDRERAWVRRIGATCYGVYVLHYPLGGLFRPLVPWLERGATRWVALAAVIVGLPVLTDLLVRHFDVPLRRALARALGLDRRSERAKLDVAKRDAGAVVL